MLQSLQGRSKFRGNDTTAKILYGIGTDSGGDSGGQVCRSIPNMSENRPIGQSPSPSPSSSSSSQLPPSKRRKTSKKDDKATPHKVRETSLQRTPLLILTVSNQVVPRVARSTILLVGLRIIFFFRRALLHEPKSMFQPTDQVPTLS